MKRSPYYLVVLCTLSLLLMFSCPLMGQAASPKPAKENNGNETETIDLDLFCEITTEYSDNVYRLSESRQASLEEMEQEDIDSHRFDNMESDSDYILTPAIGFRYKKDSPIGGKLRLDSSVSYHWYVDNDSSRYPEGEITLSNSIGKNGTLSLEGKFIFDFFKGNYLSGCDDSNGNGNISGDERIYDSAFYDEYEGVISYEHEIMNNRGAALSEINIEPFAGYSYRGYNSPYGNRDKDIVMGGVGVSLEFFSKIDLKMMYQFEKVDSPNFRELVLFDELSALTDANGDGSLHRNAPLVTPIDRSADRHTYEIEASAEIFKNTLLFMGYRQRQSDFSSENPLDIEHYHQEATRERFRSGIEYEFSKFLAVELKYTHITDDEQGDEFTENSYLFTIKAKKIWDK